MKSVPFLAILLGLVPAIVHAASDESQEIIRLVQESQRAGWERHDIDKYLAPWADNARLIIGRAGEAGQYDTSYNRQQFAAARRLRFGGPPIKGFKVKYDNVNLKVQGDMATLQCMTTMEQPDFVESVHEVYRLHKVGGVWKIVENRAWPSENRFGDNIIRYDAERWQQLDAKVREQQQSGDLLDQAGALFEAYRFTQAYEVAKRLTQQGPEQVSHWVLRGHLALLVGNADDALSSFRQAIKLDAETPIPDYARAALKKKE